jgi:hypothetical protein
MDKGYRDTEYTLEEKKVEMKDLPEGSRMKLDSWVTWNYSKPENKTTTTINVKGITETHLPCSEIIIDVAFKMLDEGELTYLQGFAQYRMAVINALNHSNKLTSEKYGLEAKIKIPFDAELLVLFEQYRISLS